MKRFTTKLLQVSFSCHLVYLKNKQTKLTTKQKNADTVLHLDSYKETLHVGLPCTSVGKELVSLYDAPDSSPSTTRNPGIVAHAYNPRTWEGREL